MPSPEGDKRGNAIHESRAQDIDATDAVIVHGSHPPFGSYGFLFYLPFGSSLFFFKS